MTRDAYTKAGPRGVSFGKDVRVPAQMSLFWGSSAEPTAETVAVPSDERARSFNRESFGGDSYGGVSLLGGGEDGTPPELYLPGSRRGSLVDPPLTGEVSPVKPDMARVPSRDELFGVDFFTPPGESPRREHNQHADRISELFRGDTEPGPPRRSTPSPLIGSDGDPQEDEHGVPFERGSASRPPESIASSAPRDVPGGEEQCASRDSSKGSWVGSGGRFVQSVSPVIIDQSWTLMAGEANAAAVPDSGADEEGGFNSPSSDGDSPSGGEWLIEEENGLLVGEVVAHTFQGVEWLRLDTQPESLTTRTTPRAMDASGIAVSTAVAAEADAVVLGTLYVTNFRLGWSPCAGMTEAARNESASPHFSCGLPCHSIDYARTEDVSSSTLGESFVNLAGGGSRDGPTLRLGAKDGRLLRLRFREHETLNQILQLLRTQIITTDDNDAAAETLDDNVGVLRPHLFEVKPPIPLSPTIATEASPFSPQRAPDSPSGSGGGGGEVGGRSGGGGRRRGSMQRCSSLSPPAVEAICGRQDFERQGVPWSHWRVTEANALYGVCATYSAGGLVVPSAVSDQDLREAARFRSRQRFPCLVYYDRYTGASITRASQPLVGVSSNRNAKDENLIRAIYDANTNGTELQILDCRSRMATLGNMIAHGAGVESRSHGYETCSIEHQDMPNIHAVSSSVVALAELCQSTAHREAAGSQKSAKWLGSLEKAGWFEGLRYLLAAAERLVLAVAKRRASCLVHCSDGWDRTTQLVSLAALLLDPYYRTTQGFGESLFSSCSITATTMSSKCARLHDLPLIVPGVLVEREWIRTGHQFASRSGHHVVPSAASTTAAEENVSPIFVQWLDAVWQVQRQFPTAFEFGESLLLLLGRACYSMRFRNFAFDCEAERTMRRQRLQRQLQRDRATTGPGAVAAGAPGADGVGVTALVKPLSAPPSSEGNRENQGDEIDGIGSDSCIWAYVERHKRKFRNPFWVGCANSCSSGDSSRIPGPALGGGVSGAEGEERVLRPSCNADAVQLWSAMHMPDEMAPRRTADTLCRWGHRATMALAQSEAEIARLRTKLAALLTQVDE